MAEERPSAWLYETLGPHVDKLECLDLPARAPPPSALVPYGFSIETDGEVPFETGGQWAVTSRRHANIPSARWV